MSLTELELLASVIKVDTKIKPGVVFRYMGPIIKDLNYRTLFFEILEKKIKALKIRIDGIACQQSRGYWFLPLADRLKCKFIPLTKSPYSSNTISVEYSKEYSKDGNPDTLYLDEGMVSDGDNILIVDDLIATGGTMNAGIELVEKAGGNVLGCVCGIEFVDLESVYDKDQYPTISLLKYRSDDQSTSFDKELNDIQPESKELTYIENPYNHDDLNTIVFYYPTVKHIAKMFCGDNTSRLGHIKWDTFPDGTPNIQIENTDNLIGKKIIFIMDLSDLSKLFTQLSALIVVQRKQVLSLDIHIPYFSVGTMERCVTDGEVATAETLSKIISSLCEPDNKKPVIHLYDLHALANRFYFDHSKCTVIMESSIPILKKNFCDLNTIIVYPDDGAHKRFTPFFTKHRQIVMSKTRDGDLRKISVKEYIGFPKNSSIDFKNFKLLIVDDLCQSGGTLLEVISALKELGYTNISCYVTHGVFPKESYKKFYTAGIQNFYVTESLNQNHKFQEPFKCISLIDSNSTYQEIIVAVTSITPLKMIAAYNKISKILKYSNIKVIGIKVNSKVNNQPFGYTETISGAYFRLLEVMKMKIRPNYIVSFENGITSKTSGEYFDFYSSIILDVNNDHYDFSVCNRDMSKDIGYLIESWRLQTKSIVTESFDSTVRIPYEIYIKFVNKSFQSGAKITIGDIIHQEYGYDSQDWHEYFDENSRTRCDLLSI